MHRISPVIFMLNKTAVRKKERHSLTLYGLAAHKVIALDAGHVCQNLYLACETIHAGTCAIAAYNQEEMDELLGLDGDEAFAVYLAPVGKIKAK